MKIAMVEDEKPASEKLKKALRSYDPKIEVVAVLTSVRETVQWLQSNPMPDLILLDIELSDGRSFSIFKQVHVSCPVIFTTAYDQFVIDAFECNAIDYLLKPVKQEKLNKALYRYFRLKKHFTADFSGLIEQLQSGGRYKKRLVARHGNELLSVAVDDVAYFFLEHRMVFLTTKSGRKCLIDKTMSALEVELDPATFFRLNRQVMAHISAVRKFRSSDKSKIDVILEPPTRSPVVVSQEKASLFKSWVER